MGQPTVIADSFILAAEIASNPPVPDINSLQVYVKDVAGISHPFTQDHAGTVRDLFIPKGTATNDNAAAGEVGQYASTIVLSAAAVGLTSGVSTTIASVSLTAGDWDVWGELWTKPAALTLQDAIQGSVGAAAPAAVADATSLSIVWGTGAPAASVFVVPVSVARLSLASTTSILLIANITFTVSTCAAYGKIAARRMR